MHIGMPLLHPAAADHSVSISRQQVQRIFRFSLRSRAGARPLSGGTGAVATGGPTNWRTDELEDRRIGGPTNWRADELEDRRIGGPTNWDPYQKATDTAPSRVPWRPPVPLFFGAG